MPGAVLNTFVLYMNSPTPPHHAPIMAIMTKFSAGRLHQISLRGHAMPLVDDVLAVLIDGSLLGPLLSFNAQVRLGKTNRACRRLYAAAWRCMWRARASTAARRALANGATLHSFVPPPTLRSITHEVRRMLRRSVEYSKVEHVREILLGAVGKQWQQRLVILRNLIDGQSFLHIAARLIRNRFTPERLAVLELLLEVGGIDLACQRINKVRVDDKESNASALHLCATGQSVPAVEALVRAGGDVLLFGRTSMGFTCLHYAVITSGSSTAVVEALAALGGIVLLEAKDHNGETCLLKAARIGRVDHVRALVRAGGASLIKISDENGATCLFIAAQNGRLAVVEELIEVGGPELLFTTLHDGTSCLAIAAMNGYLDVVLCLLTHGGQQLALLCTTDNNTSALHLAACNGSRAIVEALIACGGQQLMMQRIVGGSDDGRTCLHFAAAENSCDVVELFIALGGRDLLLAVDSKNRSALFMAVGQGHYEVVVMMLHAGGCELLQCNKVDGTSCLVLAAKRGHCKIVGALASFAYEFRKGSDGKLTDECANEHYTSQIKLALVAAKSYGHRDVVDFLKKGRRRIPAPPPRIHQTQRLPLFSTPEFARALMQSSCSIC